MRVFITGVGGSGGSYLAECIAREAPAAEIAGTTRSREGSPAKRNLALVRDRVRLFEADLLDFSSLQRALGAFRPDVIFHLASNADVRTSFDTPLAVMESNVTGTLNLLEALRCLALDPTIVLCSSSEVYGQVRPEEMPIRESQMFQPLSPYAVSKATQDLLGYSYHRAHGQKIIRTRMFSYLNPRRSGLFATSFALQVARIELGRQQTLRHGNLESVRAFIDVRDAMSCYWEISKRGVPGEAYNMGGGPAHSVGEFLELLKSRARCPIPSQVDPALLRPADIGWQTPDTSKFLQLTNWKPRYSFEQSVDFLLESCRAIARAEA